MAGGRPYSPDEIAVLKPFVAELCRWDEVLPRLEGRSYASATHRLSKLRREAGTLWRVAPCGEANRSAKLNAEAAGQIRALAGKASQRAVASQYGISQRQVGRIQAGERWADVAA